MKALYAFSGDPITNGHIDIIKRTVELFGNVTVAIGVNPAKKYTFSLEERLKMATVALENIPQITKVVAFKGLLVDYAYENGFHIIVRGVRNSTDFDYEAMIHFINETQQLGIETLPLFADRSLSHISSSAVKSIQQENGFVHEYVPLYIKQCLEYKISKQFIIGLTGSIGSGKSYIGNQIVKIGDNLGKTVHHIEIDNIAHDILENLTQPLYIKTRQLIADEFGQDRVMNRDGFINRKILGEIVFNDNFKMSKLNAIMKEPVMMHLKRQIYGKEGIVIINSALLVEANLLFLCNNNVILLDAKGAVKKRLEDRGLNEDQINKRISAQYTYEQKFKKIISNKDNCFSELICLDNSVGNNGLGIFPDIMRIFSFVNRMIKEMTCGN